MMVSFRSNTWYEMKYGGGLALPFSSFIARSSSARRATNPTGAGADTPANGSTRSTVGFLVGTTGSPAVDTVAPFRASADVPFGPVGWLAQPSESAAALAPRSNIRPAIVRRPEDAREFIAPAYT